VLDTNKAYDAIAGFMLMQMHEGLTYHSRDLVPQPGLAEKWEFNDEYTEITFTLRPNLKWSDGVPLTADDFEYSWKRLLDPNTAAEYAYFLYDVAGAEAYNAGEGSVDEVGVTALDERHLRVSLRRPAPFFPHITTFMVTYPVRRDLIERYGNAWTEAGNIAVTGPFVPVEHIHEYRMALEPNPHWALGEQGIDRLEMYMTAEKSTALNLFVAGQMDIVLDMLPIAIPAYRGKPEYFNGSKLEVRYIGLRLDEPPMDDVRVRKALAMSIQRTELPNVLKGGELPTNTWLPPGMFGHAPEIGYGYQPDRARKLLAEAGYPEGEGFPGFRLLFRAGDDWRLVAENLQQQWKRELGIDVEIQVREQKAFFREIDGEAPPPTHLARWIADFPDPENFMSLFKSNSGNNTLGFASDRYDELVEQAVRTDSPDARKNMYDEAQRILVVEEAAMIPIYTAAQNVLRKPELQKLHFNPMGDARLGEVRWGKR
jgi:oligopeptide transport system substrate-binding protein